MGLGAYGDDSPSVFEILLQSIRASIFHEQRLVDIQKIRSRLLLLALFVEQLANRYVRSFTISGDRIYFVSGLPTDGSVIKTASILCCDLSTFQLLAEYPVPDSLAGMASLMPIQDYFYITVSTDLSGSQDAATIIRTHSLTDLSAGKYTDLYQKYFVGGGTPYYLGCIDGTFYLTEHRLQDHAIWQFHISDQNTLSDVLSLY